MKDERIEQAKNKIRSEIAIIILFAVTASFLVKTLVFKMDIRESITEFSIMIFFPLYQFIRMHMMKISIYSKPENKQAVKKHIIAMVVVVIGYAVYIFASLKKSAVYDWKGPLVFLLIYSVLFLALYIITTKYNQYRVHKYEDEFDNDKHN